MYLFCPPYGIKFNSNWQVSTRSRDVKDGKLEHISREPEMVRAFRDTWRDGIHSYLSYLRDRLIVVRDLLTDSGSIFVQIGDENVHRVRALMDEVFGPENCLATIVVRKTTGKGSSGLDNTYDLLLWYAKEALSTKSREMYFERTSASNQNYKFDWDEAGQFKKAKNTPHRISQMNPLTSQSSSSITLFEFEIFAKKFKPKSGGWKTNLDGMIDFKKLND